MGGKVNKETYEKLIVEDIKWLLAGTEDCLERKHIIDVLNASIDIYYHPDIGMIIKGGPYY